MNKVAIQDVCAVVPHSAAFVFNPLIGTDNYSATSKNM